MTTPKTSLFREPLYELFPNAICIVAHNCEKIKSAMEKIGEVDMSFWITTGIRSKGTIVCSNSRKSWPIKTKIVIYSGSLTPAEQLELEKTGAGYQSFKL